MRRLLFFAPAAVFVVLVGFFLSQLLLGRNPAIIPSALLDRPVPEFTLPGIEGRAEAEGGDGAAGFATADLQGELTVVNVFASWCIPCLAEHPLISRLAEDGYQVFGLNHRDKDPDAAGWLRRNGDPYTRVGADRDARVSVDWGVTGVPETYIVDASGVIRYKHVGPLTVQSLEDEFMPRLKAEGG